MDQFPDNARDLALKALKQDHASKETIAAVLLAIGCAYLQGKLDATNYGISRLDDLLNHAERRAKTEQR